mgnify:CR=1 FL=1
MQKTLRTLKKKYRVQRQAEAVCKLLEENDISAEDLIQASRWHTRKLIKAFYLLACAACLEQFGKPNRQSNLLCRYAKRLNQLSQEYENLFRRNAVAELNNQKQNTSYTDNTLDRLQARLFYLMTQYTVHPCRHIAASIVNQLNTLCEHPHIELLPAQRYIYCQSINYWRSCLINSKDLSSTQNTH